jgi:phosphatidylglycerophosphate synthase
VTGGTADARLAAAVKSDDGLFTTLFVTPYSKYVARWAANRGIAPNAVTVAGLAVGAGATVAFAFGTRATLVLGAVLLQAAFTLDCVDGQLARYSGRTSPFGGWLDAMGDRAKEFAVYGGLAVGSARSFHDPVWDLALAALALQAGRQTLDLAFARRAAAAPGPGGGIARLSSTLDTRRPWSRWVRRTLVLPIGERLFLISLTAALFRPEITFAALLAWGGFAAAYALTGRILRSVA